jgi:hypothetical protein
MKGRLKVRENYRKNGESERTSSATLKTGHSRRKYLYISGHNSLSIKIQKQVWSL